MGPSKVAPRYVPTLTEVVVPASPSTALGNVSGLLQPATPPAEEDELVARVLARLMPAIRSHVEQAVLESAHIQARAMLPSLLEDVDGLVRSAVREAVQGVSGESGTA